MSNICDFERILKTECNLDYFTWNCRIENLDDFERDEADTYLWSTGLLHVEEKGMTICYIMGRCFSNVFERREIKCCAVLIKHRCKVKGEQVTTLQMTQQLKSKNINAVSGQLFSRQCKARFFLETDSLYWWWR